LLDILIYFLQLKTKTKEKLTEVKHGSLGSSGDESGFLSPLEHVSPYSLSLIPIERERERESSKSLGLTQ
jgi:hypothetical protein